MSSQRALHLSRKQGPLLITTHSIPTPSQGEIIIKIQAAALNPIDWKIQAYSGRLREEDYPVVLGHDISGVVEAVGDGVEEAYGLKVGDRAVGLSCVPPSQKNFNEFGGFQEYARVFADLVVKIPDSMSFSEAATIPVCLGTAAIGLFSENGAGLNPMFDRDVKHRGEVAVVVGGGSSVGQYAIQLLKFAGVSTIITYASEHHTEYLRTLGATHVIDRKSVTIQDLPSEVKRVTNSNPVKVVLDAISHTDTRKRLATRYWLLVRVRVGLWLSLGK
ncbi:GroES-like protein [Marasmius fiardii PR-910]|nr:GroES-like protein [Marasmius fiardii PR-910]